MQGRSLIRAVEIGLVAAVLGAAALLCALVWSAHQLDRTARAGEAEMVRQVLEPEIAEFRHGLAQAATDPQGWTDRDRQRQILYPVQAVGGPRQGRIAELIGIGATRQHLERLRDGYGIGSAGKPRIDFVMLGADGGEELALIAPVPASGGGRPALAIALVDFSELTQRLERLSLHLLPLRAPGGADGAQGRLQLTGLSGDVVAVLAWQSARASDMLQKTVLPILIVIFASAMAGLVVLLDRSRALAARIATAVPVPFELPQSPEDMRLAAARNPAKIDSLMQVS